MKQTPGMRPIDRDEDDGWEDPHEAEDPYIDHIRIDLPHSDVDNSDADEETSSDGVLEILYGAPEEGEEGEEIDALALTSARMAAYRATTRPYVTLAFESLAHMFAWEGHNSSENQAFAYGPSQRLSQHSDLRSVAAGFDQVDSDGRPAAMSFTAPEGFNGDLLYVREDLVKAYAGDRSVVTFGWGERQIHAAWPEQIPDRLLKVYRTYRNIWRTHRVVAEGQTEAVGGRQDSEGQPE